MTRDGLLAFYDRVLLPGAPEGRRLATHVYSKRAAPKGLVVDAVADDFYPPPPDLSAELRAAARGGAVLKA